MLNSIPLLIEKTFPIPSRFKSSLPSDIAELSRLLTNKRGERSLSYLTRPNFLSAYLYYFLPWNLYRLCLLLPSINLNLSSGDSITDIGCGPLTFASALWISRPDLRKIPLEINCIDRSGPALEAGKKFFEALCNHSNAGENKDKPDNLWKINLLKQDIDFRKTKKPNNKNRKKPSLVCALNIFNEIYDNISHNNTDGLRQIAQNAALFLHNEASEDGTILTVEPGVPQSGKFISMLRNELIKLNRLPLSPCTHAASCPYLPPPKTGHAQVTRGRNWIDTKKRWCHFSFETASAPAELHKLSKAAKLPKERLVFSYIYTDKVSVNKKSGGKMDARVISDMFLLPENRYGRYGCSEKGLILITGDIYRMEELTSLTMIPQNNLIEFSSDNQYDKKSGALIRGAK